MAAHFASRFRAARSLGWVWELLLTPSPIFSIIVKSDTNAVADIDVKICCRISKKRIGGASFPLTVTEGVS